MPSFELIVFLNGHQHFLEIDTRESLGEIKNRIQSRCCVDLINREYVLEIYDTILNDYIVLTERYLMEIKKRLSTRENQRLQARLEPYQRNIAAEELSSTIMPYRSYVVVWLDEHIGRPEDYLSRKRVFNSMVDVDDVVPLPVGDWLDLENLILYKSEPVYTTIRFFDKSDDCLTFIRENAVSTAIFLVTSPYFGRIIVPLVVDQVYAIYVLCVSISLNVDWALDYIEHIQLFDFDTDLVIRLTRDIADYYVRQGKERMIGNDPRHAAKYFINPWRLLSRVNRIDKENFDKRLEYTGHLLEKLTDNQTEFSQCDEDLLRYDKLMISDDQSFSMNLFKYNS